MPRVALTFDDGPGPVTGRVLDLLRAARARATFFLLGRNIEEAPWCGGDRARACALVRRVLEEGHVAGNHTYSHVRPEDWRRLADDLRRNDDVIRACRREAGLPADAPIPVRLPYGVKIVSETVPAATGTLAAGVLDPRLAVLASLGRTHVHWTSDFDDWTLAAEAGPDLAARMLAHVERAAALGLDAVLDLHDSGTGSSWGYDRPATAAALERFLPEIARRGIETFTVPAGA